jgi:hypothetical protein
VRSCQQAFYRDFRGQRRHSESFSFGKRFPIRERMAFSLRVEFFDVLNRQVSLPKPSTNKPQTAPARNAQKRAIRPTLRVLASSCIVGFRIQAPVAKTIRCWRLCVDGSVRAGGEPLQVQLRELARLEARVEKASSPDSKRIEAFGSGTSESRN